MRLRICEYLFHWIRWIEKSAGLKKMVLSELRLFSVLYFFSVRFRYTPKQLQRNLDTRTAFALQKKVRMELSSLPSSLRTLRKSQIARVTITEDQSKENDPICVSCETHYNNNHDGQDIHSEPYYNRVENDCNQRNSSSEYAQMLVCKLWWGWLRFVEIIAAVNCCLLLLKTWYMYQN